MVNETETPVATPVVVSRVVVCPAGEAFAAWTERIDEWWPRARTAGGDAVERVLLETVPGGRLFERWRDGAEHLWATVIECDPPARLVFAWAQGEAAGTEVMVSFERLGPASTRVTVEHRGFERIADGAAVRALFEAGPDSPWNAPLAAFGESVVDPAVHRYFGVRLNNAAWDLFDPPDDPQLLLHVVHTSAWHWRQIGAPENRVRADWMCSHAYALLGHGALAAAFAATCRRVCEEHGIGDFDLAYAYEAGARAAAACGDLADARRMRVLAREAGDAIADPEDKAIFDGDYALGPWFGADAE